MKKRKVWLARILVFVMLVVSIIPIVNKKEVMAVSQTADQAIAWCQSKIGTSVGYNDGSGEYQCVEFIQGYYQMLGVSKPTGNGKDYATNSLPSGWTRVQGGTPKKGDILVYGASSSNQYGHVAIYESDYVTYHQNFNKHPYVEKVTSLKYNQMTNPYWGYIRPNWRGGNNPPQGMVDSITTGTGYIKVNGWAFDTDNKSTSIAVHVYIGGKAGESGAEGRVITANKSRPDVDKAYGCGTNHGYQETLYTAKSGAQAVYVYAIDSAGGTNTLLGTKTVTITKDTVKPTISNVTISNVTESGYTISCQVSDNCAISNVQFPTWTVKGNQDDLKWHKGVVSGGTAYYNVKISDHNNEKGVYVSDVYAYDLTGNVTSVRATIDLTAALTPENTPSPTITVPETTLAPTSIPTTTSTAIPTTTPTAVPTTESTVAPTSKPTIKTSERPTVAPTDNLSNTHTSDLISTLIKKENLSIKTVCDEKKLQLQKVKGLKVKKYGLKRLKVSWNAVVDRDGYEVQYALNKTFKKGKKTVNCNKNSKTVKLKKLKAKKKYFVRIRAYKLSGGKKLYGSWSAIKTCTAK